MRLCRFGSLFQVSVVSGRTSGAFSLHHIHDVPSTEQALLRVLEVIVMSSTCVNASCSDSYIALQRFSGST